MQIEIHQTVSTSLGLLQEGTTHNVEPNFAERLIAANQAKVVGSSEPPVYPANFPHAEVLYAAGITHPNNVDAETLQTIPGITAAEVLDIHKYLQPKVAITLPADIPHRAKLIARGYTHIDAVIEGRGLSRFLTPDEQAQIGNYVDAILAGTHTPASSQPEIKQPEKLEPPTSEQATNPAVYKAEKAIAPAQSKKPTPATSGKKTNNKK